MRCMEWQSAVTVQATLKARFWQDLNEDTCRIVHAIHNNAGDCCTSTE